MIRMAKQFASAALACLALLLPSLADAAATVTGMQLLNAVRVDRTKYDYTYVITVANDTRALSGAKATVVSSASTTRIVKGTVDLGNLAAGATVTSVDTFTLRQDRTVPFNPSALTWTVAGGSSPGNVTLDIAVSDTVVAPSGSVTVTPVLRDGNGSIISNTGFQFDTRLAPIGRVFGNAPTVSGLVVTFTKLAKRLLNQNVVLDPTGDYADTDPNDPRYGQETSGTYRLTVSVASLGLSASRDVVVLPTGTAAITLQTSKYAQHLASLLALSATAAQTGDTGLMDRARAMLTAVVADSDQSTEVLEVNVAAAPPDGSNVPPDLMAAGGFVAGPQDVAFAAAVADVLSKMRQARLQVETLDVSALSQQAVEALSTALQAYKQASQNLRTLTASPLATSQQQDVINDIIAAETPRLLDAIKLKTAQALGVAVTARTSHTRAAADATDDPLLDPSPRAMYAAIQPTQYSTFFFTTFSAFTDLSGTALANILELSVTLANYITNLEIAHIVNQTSNGSTGIDYCLGSTSFAFVCPNYIPTRVGGYGFGRDPSKASVAIIGCVNAELIRNLLRLKVPPTNLSNAKNLAAAIRFGKKLYSLIKALQKDTGFAAIIHPTFIGDDDLGVSSDMMNFSNGWPQVNQGRLPCAGVVVFLNLQTGDLTAVNMNFLSECGG